MTYEQELLLRSVQSLLNIEDNVALQQLLSEMHPVDVAGVLTALADEDRQRLLLLLDVERVALVLVELDYESQFRLLHLAGAARASAVLVKMPADEVAELLRSLEPAAAERLLQLVGGQEAISLRNLMVYPADSAGGIMTNEFIALRENMTAQQAIDVMRKIGPDAETIYYIYVTDQADRLVGVLSLRELIVAAANQEIGAIMTRSVIKVAIDTDQEQVAKTIARYDLLAVPVVDERERLVGIVTFDDAIDVLEEEATEDFFRTQAAVTAPVEGEFSSPALARSWRRLPWLVALLVGELFAGSVIAGFAKTKESVAILAFFIPVLAGTAGNIGTQSLTMVVRGLATGELTGPQAWRVIGREAQVGLVVGLVCGVLLFGIAFLWHGMLLVAIVVALALLLNMVMATVAGSFFPLLFRRLGIDPAIASGPFIATFLDVTGLFNYFWLATFFLDRFYQG